MKKWCVLLSTIFFFVSLVEAAPISKLIVFGDSLSDNGNSFAYTKHQLPPSVSYYKGRYSNGPIWIDRLADKFFGHPVAATQVLNYAFGGAGVLKMQASSFLLSQEIDSYLLAHSSQIDENSLFMIWMGANDYLMMPDAMESDVKDVVHQIKTNILRLVTQGAKHIMVFALPDLGLTPFAKELELSDEFSIITQLHNQHLQQMMSELQTQLPEIDWLYFDMNQLFLDIQSQPQSYGLINMVDKCLQQPPVRRSSKIESHVRRIARMQGDCDAYLFFDQLHPTAKTHQIIANQIDKFLKNQDLQANRLTQ